MKNQFATVVHIPKDWHDAKPEGRNKQVDRQLKTNKPTPEHIKLLRSKLIFYSPQGVREFLVDDKGRPSIWTVYEWIKSGELESQPVGRLYKVTSFQLADFLERQSED